MENKFLAVFGAVTISLVGIILLSMFSAGLWFCFDDSIAAAFGYPPIGSLDLLTVWPATIFVAHIFGWSKSARKSEK